MLLWQFEQSWCLMSLNRSTIREMCCHIFFWQSETRGVVVVILFIIPLIISHIYILILYYLSFRISTNSITISPVPDWLVLPSVRFLIGWYYHQSGSWLAGITISPVPDWLDTFGHKLWLPANFVSRGLFDMVEWKIKCDKKWINKRDNKPFSSL